jgi:hypothetical protein
MYWDMWTLFTTQSMFWFLLGLMGAASVLDAETHQQGDEVAAPATRTPPINRVLSKARAQQRHADGAEARDLR